MSKSTSILIVLALAGLATFYAGHKYLGWWGDAPQNEAGAGAGKASSYNRLKKDQVSALARLEPADGVIDVAALPGDRLEKLLVKLGDQVKKGQELVRLESLALRQTERDLAQSQLDEALKQEEQENRYAAALLTEAELGIKLVELQSLDIDAQQKKIGVLRSAVATGQNDLKRLKALDRAIVSEQEIEHQQLAVERAQTELSANESAIKKLQESLTLARGQAEAKLETARANQARIPSLVRKESLERALKLANQRVELSKVTATSDGEILKVGLADGEMIGQLPILQMADTSRMVAVAEVYEDEALRIKAGQTATLTSNALPSRLDNLKGTVVHVGSLVAKNAVVTLDPSANVDLRVIEARVELEPNPELRRLINLQVTVRIDALPAEPRTAVAASNDHASAP